MKKYILATLLYFITFISFGQISSDKNYVLYSVYKKPVPVGNETTADEKTEAIVYLNGKGEIIQKTAINGGGNKEDIIFNNDYDVLGREKKKYLAYPKATNNGAYLTNYITETTAYYDKVKYDYTKNPFEEVVFDDFRLTVPKEIAHAGNDWKLTSGHTQKNSRTTNLVTDKVWKFQIGYGASNKPILVNGGTFAQNLLYKEILKNENWIVADGNNNTTQIFTDFLGRKILVRKFDSGVAHDTYYVYDDQDNIVFILPPAIDYSVFPDKPALDAYAYQYKYDKKNRLTEKKFPGIVGWNYIVYDTQNRIALTQNNAQSMEGTWSFIKYDPLGRIAYTGILIDDLYPNQIDKQNQTNLLPSFVTKTTTPVNINGKNVYYSNNNPEALIVRDINYYDNYNFDLDGIIVPSITTYGDGVLTSSKGLITGFKSLIGNGALSTTVYGYDRKNRVVHTSAKNIQLATFDISESKIDFTGKVLETKSTHTKTGVITNLVTFDYFTYDHADRLLKHTQKIGNNAIEPIAFNYYDELGNTVRKKVGRGITKTSLTGINLVNGIYTKTVTSSWTNATLATTTALVNNGSLSFRVGDSADNQLTLGLSYAPASTSYNQIDYAVTLTVTSHASGGKTAVIQELGSNKFTINYLQNDEFTIERMGNIIYYKKNGATIYQSLTSASVQNLYGDGNFYTLNSTISDLQIDNYTFTNALSLQNISYDYNVRGMLTKINEVTGPGAGLFNMAIGYGSSTGTATPTYDGNVSSISWKTINDISTNLRSYNFSYDHLHRLRSAAYYQGIESPVTGMYDENVTYDKNGNILSLKRYSANPSTAMIDDLLYKYDGNSLSVVRDLTNNPEGFTDSASLKVEYTYDQDGNLTSDANKGITNIVYNEMNLPTRITFSGTNKYIDFLYDTRGNKLSKSVLNGSITTLTEYAGNLVYVKVGGAASQLQYMTHPEGYAAYNAGKFSYIYQYADHLGNVRLSYTDSDKNGIAEVIQENNYYPFGLKHKGYNSAANPALGNPYNKIGFQGQEIQEDFGLNWNSFKWRNYDPALGRFFSIDPLAEKYSFMTPYQFSSNQPMHAPELEGMESAYPIDDEQQGSDNPDYSWEFQFDDNLIITSINGEKVDVEYAFAQDREPIEEESSIATKVADVLTYAPGGGVIDMYRGMRDGDWVQFALGTASLGLDVFTLGSASLVKGAVMAGVKQGAKTLAKEVAEEGVEAVVKHAATTGGQTLRHYTTEAGYKGIMESGEIFASTGVKNARHGVGQYFTDLTSGYTSGQISRRLFGVPWNSKKLTHFIDVDVSGLNVIKNAPNNFLVPGTNSLPLDGRIVNHGASIFK